MANIVGTQIIPTATHWGAYRAKVKDGSIVSITPFPGDPDPSPIGRGMPQAITDDLRIGKPMVRKGWLEHGPHEDATDTRLRGGEPFVEIDWNTALGLVASELSRVKRNFGNSSIYAGSYGWASAGRFHHAQSQMRRFLNMFGGHTYSMNTYSSGAAEVIVPHVAGPFDELCYQANTTWGTIAANTQLLVAFGGIALKNAQVHGGGIGRHAARDALQDCKNKGVSFVNLSPLQGDVDAFLSAQWLALHPNTDVAVMLGLAHTLVSENLHNEEFLRRYCVGADRFVSYLMGKKDGTVKDAAWAASISGLNEEEIRSLARRMAAKRTLVTASWSLQRADHGEQTYWMLITLAAMIGQIGLPGGGFGFAYAGASGVGNPGTPVHPPTVPKPPNPVHTFIPVARISDLLLHPGETLNYDGETLTYPDIKLIYWCGGNVFHHHQNLGRLVKAWQRPETVVVHEAWWNSMARHADIVLPVTTTFERNDLTGTALDTHLLAMHKAIEPFGEALNDHDIFAGLAQHLGFDKEFTEERSETDWIKWLYDEVCERASNLGINTSDFDTFWKDGSLRWPEHPQRIALSDFRSDPISYPLQTPSGKIELFSQEIESYGYPDCPGHATWLEPREWLGSSAHSGKALHLISNQPKTRLHSQYDNGGFSQESKVSGREPVQINADDAAARGIVDGDVVRLFNVRGSCLAGAVITNDIRAGVVQLSTGAWFDPETPGDPGAMCVHGNANTLTSDHGTSNLAQACSAQSCLVEVEKLTGDLPPVKVFKPPVVIKR